MPSSDPNGTSPDELKRKVDALLEANRKIWEKLKTTTPEFFKQENADIVKGYQDEAAEAHSDVTEFISTERDSLREDLRHVLADAPLSKIQVRIVEGADAVEPTEPIHFHLTWLRHGGPAVDGGRHMQDPDDLKVIKFLVPPEFHGEGVKIGFEGFAVVAVNNVPLHTSDVDLPINHEGKVDQVLGIALERLPEGQRTPHIVFAIKTVDSLSHVHDNAAPLKWKAEFEFQDGNTHTEQGHHENGADPKIISIPVPVDNARGVPQSVRLHITDAHGQEIPVLRTSKIMQTRGPQGLQPVPPSETLVDEHISGRFPPTNVSALLFYAAHNMHPLIILRAAEPAAPDPHQQHLDEQIAHEERTITPGEAAWISDEDAEIAKELHAKAHDRAHGAYLLNPQIIRERLTDPRLVNHANFTTPIREGDVPLKPAYEEYLAAVTWLDQRIAAIEGNQAAIEAQSRITAEEQIHNYKVINKVLTAENIIAPQGGQS